MPLKFSAFSIVNTYFLPRRAKILGKLPKPKMSGILLNLKILLSFWDIIRWRVSNVVDGYIQLTLYRVTRSIGL